MPQKPLPQAKKQEVIGLLQRGWSHRKIARTAGVSPGSVSNIKGMHDVKVPDQSDDAEPTSEPVSHLEIRKLLKRHPHTAEELADALDCGPSKIRTALEGMKARGALLIEIHGKYDIQESFAIAPGAATVDVPTDSRQFGVLGDNHLCNKHSRLDVLRAAYKEFHARGITEVFNTGNWIDGEARFNKTELITAPGMDNQIDYMIQEYPKIDGITTHYIAGDDHEGWYQQREGVEIGRYLQLRAEESGRSDLRYLGYGECDVKLKHGSGSACMRVVHPGGGSSYAISYTDQKRVESYQGGEKPQIELAGHYHKANYGYPREVHTVQTGCTCDQTMFMRKKRLQAHVGFWIINLSQDEKGAITRFGTEWFPFFDRGFYEHRF